MAYLNDILGLLNLRGQYQLGHEELGQRAKEFQAQLDQRAREFQDTLGLDREQAQRLAQQWGQQFSEQQARRQFEEDQQRNQVARQQAQQNFQNQWRTIPEERDLFQSLLRNSSQAALRRRAIPNIFPTFGEVRPIEFP